MSSGRPTAVAVGVVAVVCLAGGFAISGAGAAGTAPAATLTATQVDLDGATISGQVEDGTGTPVPGATVYVESFVVPTNASVAGTISKADKHRFTVSPTAGLAPTAFDDPSDTFRITHQRWNGIAWANVSSATATRAELRSYAFPASEFPDVDVDVTDGFTLIDTSFGPTGTVTMGTVPAVDSDTGWPSTTYSIRAVTFDGSGQRTTGTDLVTGQSGATANADVVLPGTTGPCPLGSFVQRYDTDGDCAISIGELGQASSDYATGTIGIGELGQVSAAYVRT